MKIPIYEKKVVLLANLTEYHGRVGVTRTNTRTGLQDLYERFVNGTDPMSFEDAYPYIWKLIFTPSPPVRAKLSKTIGALQLVPRQYVSAHVRARYDYNATADEVAGLASNAVRCASQLDPNLPVYMASDNEDVLTNATEYANGRRDELAAGISSGSGLPRVAWHVPDPNPPLQLDARPFNETVEYYYDTFVDLYLLAMGKCVTYTIGGFGSWARWIGGMGNCSFQQPMEGKSRGTLDPKHLCEWKDAAAQEHGRSQEVGSTIDIDFRSVFADPMPAKNHSVTINYP